MYKWNCDIIGINDVNWLVMNKLNVVKVVNVKYDVIYNGYIFVIFLLVKFVVKDV